MSSEMDKHLNVDLHWIRMVTKSLCFQVVLVIGYAYDTQTLDWTLTRYSHFICL